MTDRTNLKPSDFIFWNDLKTYGCCEGCRLKGKLKCDEKCDTFSHKNFVYCLKSYNGKNNFCRYLCPKCYEKIVLKEDKREQVEFT